MVIWGGIFELAYRHKTKNYTHLFKWFYFHSSSGNLSSADQSSSVSQLPVLTTDLSSHSLLIQTGSFSFMPKKNPLFFPPSRNPLSLSRWVNHVLVFPTNSFSPFSSTQYKNNLYSACFGILDSGLDSVSLF